MIVPLALYSSMLLFCYFESISVPRGRVAHDSVLRNDFAN